MGSITREQAALVAAVAMVLFSAYYLIDNIALMRDAPMPVLLGSAIPSMVWAGFFFVVCRKPSSVRAAAWTTLVFAVLLEGAAVLVRFQLAVNYWTPFGNALSLSGWALRLGWAVFLVSFALGPDHSRTRKLALVLAIVVAPFTVSTAYGAFNSWIGLLFDDIPHQAYWRVVITPAIRTVYWLSQILFLWKVSESPLTPGAPAVLK